VRDLYIDRLNGNDRIRVLSNANGSSVPRGGNSSRSYMLRREEIFHEDAS